MSTKDCCWVPRKTLAEMTEVKEAEWPIDDDCRELGGMSIFGCFKMKMNERWRMPNFNFADCTEGVSVDGLKLNRTQASPTLCTAPVNLLFVGDQKRLLHLRLMPKSRAPVHLECRPRPCQRRVPPFKRRHTHSLAKVCLGCPEGANFDKLLISGCRRLRRCQCKKDSRRSPSEAFLFLWMCLRGQRALGSSKTVSQL